VRLVRDDKVGPSLGAELRDKALLAVAIALGAQLAYLSVRFPWRWSGAAVLAMRHNAVILVGVFAWLGKPVDGVFLATPLAITSRGGGR
jgi:SecD/SecF fusion protein